MSENFKVLIAYDGSGCADAALDDLKNAGLPDKNTEILVMSIAEVWLPPHEEGENPEFITESLREKYEENLEVLNTAKERAERAGERLAGNFPAWQISAEATYGSPAWEILFRADSFKPDLIVVGSRGRSAIARVLLGSVSQKIVTEANCSVRVARGKVEVDETPARIILGYDGTNGADEAAKSIENRKWHDGSEVKVIIVEDSAIVRESLKIEEAEFERSGEDIIKKFRARGLNAALLIKEGNPKQILVEEAEKWGADCIFVGAAKFDNVVTKYLLGSVSSAVVTRAHCSVEVVRPNFYKD